jgi:hypothetical protein
LGELLETLMALDRTVKGQPFPELAP